MKTIDAQNLFQMIQKGQYQMALKCMETSIIQIDYDRLINILFKEIQKAPSKDMNAIEIKQQLEHISQQLPEKTCGKQLNQSPAVICTTCCDDQNAIFCLECFDQEKHMNHSYQFRSGNGMCDCGCEWSMKQEAFCSRHQGSINNNTSIANSSKNILNPNGIADVVYFLFTGFIISFKNMNHNAASTFANIIKDLLYHSNIYAIKRIVTNYLFLPLNKITSSKELVKDYIVNELLPIYYFSQQLNTADNISANIIPIIIFLHLHKLIQIKKYNDIMNSAVEIMERNLEQRQMGEIVYRALLQYIFYQYYDSLMNDNILKVNSLWDNAVCQICSNIIFDPFTIFIYEIYIFDAYYKMIYKSLNSDQNQILNELQLVTIPIDNIKINGINRFKQYPSINQNINAIVDDLTPKIDRILNTLKSFYLTTYDNETNYYKIEYFQVTLSSTQYAYNSLDYVSMIVQNDLLCFLELNYEYPVSQLQLPRYRDREALSYDDVLTTYIANIVSRSVHQYREGWCYYLASLRGSFDINLNQNVINSVVVRTSQLLILPKHDSPNDKQKIKQSKEIIKRIIYISLYHLFILTARKDQHYIYSTDSKYQDVPIQHGIHVQDPIYQTDNIFMIKSTVDSHNPQPQFQHPMYNVYVMYLFFQMNAWEQLLGESSSLLLNDVCNRVIHQKQSPKYNLPCLVSTCVRYLVSYTILAANGFKKLVQAEWELRRLLYEVYVQRSQFPWLSLYVLQRASLQYLRQNEVDKFIYQLFEGFGLMNMQRGEYVNRVKSPGKESVAFMHKMMHQLLTYVCTIALRDQGFKSQEEYIQKMILQVFLATEHPTERIVRDQLSYVPYDVSHAMKQFWNLAEKRVKGALEDPVAPANGAYVSQQRPEEFSLNSRGLDACALLDCALYSFPQYLSAFTGYAAAINIGCELPRDSTKYKPTLCFNQDLAKQLFQNSNVINITIDLIQLMIRKRIDFDFISDHDQLVCLIAFQQVHLHNPNNADVQQLIEELYNTTFSCSLCNTLAKQLFTQTTSNDENEKAKSPLQKLKNKLQGFTKLEQNNAQKQLQTLEDDTLIQNQQNDDVIIDKNFLEIMEAGQDTSCCIICFNNTQSKTLSSYGSITIDGIFGKIGYQIKNELTQMLRANSISVIQNLAQISASYNIYLHLCGHLVHSSCCDKKISHCHMCRQYAKITLPIIQGSTIEMNALIRVAIKSLMMFEHQSNLYINKLQNLLSQIDIKSTEIVPQFKDIDYKAALEDQRTKEDNVERNEELNSVLMVQILRILLNFFVAVATMNVRAYQIRFKNDTFSTEQEKNKYYLELLETTCSILLFINDIKRYVDVNELQKIDGIHFIEYQLPQIPPNIDMDQSTNEGNVALGTLLLSIVCQILDKKIKQLNVLASNSQLCQFLVDLQDVYSISLYKQEQYKNFVQQYNQNYANMLLSKYKYLMTCQTHPESIYQTYQYIQRVKLLQTKKNVFVADFNPQMSRYDLQKFFNTSFINMLKAVNTFQSRCQICKQEFCLERGDKIIICLQCGAGLCRTCLVNSERRRVIHCTSTGFYFIPLSNYVLVVEQDSHNVVATGGPYLDQNGEDDPGQLKCIPLYLNGLLLSGIQKTVFWDLRSKYTIDQFNANLNDGFE